MGLMAHLLMPGQRTVQILRGKHSCELNIRRRKFMSVASVHVVMGQRGSTQPEVRVLILGLDNAGKSTLLYRLKHGASACTVPTIGFNVEMLEARRNRKPIALTLWDVGGQRRMREHWPSFHADTAAVVFVVDSSDRGRLNEARRELENTLRGEQLRERPLVLLANKQDVCGALTVTELKDKFNLGKICFDRDWFVQPCSASTGFGVEEAFGRIVQMVKLPRDTTAMKDNVKETVQYIRATIRR